MRKVWFASYALTVCAGAVVEREPLRGLPGLWGVDAARLSGLRNSLLRFMKTGYNERKGIDEAIAHRVALFSCREVSVGRANIWFPIVF